ncbi:MAG: hypothetical protein ACTSYZ_07080, partial [Candidatus Helarchaeota archaeon]
DFFKVIGKYNKHAATLVELNVFQIKEVEESATLQLSMYRVALCSEIYFIFLDILKTISYNLYDFQIIY